MNFEREGTPLEKMRIGQVALKLDYKLIDNIEFEGIDPRDAPDYCDVFIVYADYDGCSMTEEELDRLNDDRDFVYEQLMDYLY